MALTNKQVYGVCNMFANAFVNAKNEEERRKILIDFEDTFSRGIVNWRKICGDRVSKLTAEEAIIESYEKLSTRNDDENKKLDCEIRPMTAEDFEQVREIMNAAFGLAVTEYEKPRIDMFINSGYSFVACKEDEILGVVLAHEQPELAAPYVYINSFAVAEHARGNGIGKALFQHLKRKAAKNMLFVMKLQTDPKIPAYEIYKHWGMEESELVLMKGYCF